MMTLLLPLILSFSFLDAKQPSSAYLFTRYQAKEYCSCRFVVKQSEKVCKRENKSTVLLFRIKEDTQNKIIQVRNIAAKAEAHFISEKEGCRLTLFEEN